MDKQTKIVKSCDLIILCVKSFNELLKILTQIISNNLHLMSFRKMLYLCVDAKEQQ